MSTVSSDDFEKGSLVELINVSSFMESGPAIFDGANLRLMAGERVLITAPVASGKSLFLKLLAGLSRPEKGVVFLFGRDMAELDADGLNQARSRMGFVFQENILISNLKVVENVALPILYHGSVSYEEAMKRSFELLEMTGFRGDAWSLPGPLPLYAKKEVALARALALDPDIIVCENIWDFLKEDEKTHISGLLNGYHSRRSNALMIFTANNENDAAYSRPDRVIRIESGSFIEQPH